MIANALHATDPTLEVFELPDERPMIVLTLIVHAPDDTGEKFAPFVLELNPANVAALCAGLAQVVGVYSETLPC